MKPALRRVHRWFALALALLWGLQALTGLAMVYRWELDDASLAGGATSVDLRAIADRIATIEAAAPGTRVTTIYATGGTQGRYDLYVDDANGDTTLVRVDGSGQVLRTRGSDQGFIATAANLHQTLLAGDAGKVVVGTFGALLLVTIGMGIVLAWPARANQWRLALWPRNARPGAARRYAWHRALGLWLALPALVFAGAGVLLAFESNVSHALGLDAQPAELQRVAAPAGEPVTPDVAFATALAQFPGSELSGAALPGDEWPLYRVRVRQPQELRRVYGTSIVYVAAADGRVVRTEDALQASPARAFRDALYPVHTGEALGRAGRLLSFGVGLWLLGSIGLGMSLWLARRRARR